MSKPLSASRDRRRGDAAADATGEEEELEWAMGQDYTDLAPKW